MEKVFQRYGPEGEHPLYWVIPGELAGRCGPEMKPWDLEHFLKIGVRGLVSVHRIPPEQEEQIASSDLDHLKLYFPAMVLTEPGHRRKFLELTEDYFSFVDHHLEQDEPVLTHCHAGLDRSCALMACYMVSRFDYAPEGAIEEITSVNPNAFVSEGYRESVHLFASDQNSSSETG